MQPRLKCQHCGRRLAVRPRVLCFPCYYTAGVRERYSVLASKYNARGVGNGNLSRLPAEPTSALPGSPEKVEVLCQRARLGVSLWHPLDATLADLPDDATRPLVPAA